MKISDAARQVEWRNQGRKGAIFHESGALKRVSVTALIPPPHLAEPRR